MTRAARCQKSTGAWFPGPHLCWSERLQGFISAGEPGKDALQPGVCPCALRPPSCLLPPSSLRRQAEGVLTVGSPPCTVSAVGRPEKTAYLVKQGMIRRHWLVPLASGCWHLASWHWSNWEGVELLGQRTPVIHPVHARHPKPPTGS